MSKPHLDLGYDAVYSAWINFRKHKKSTNSIDDFEYCLEENLQSLVLDIQNQSYKHNLYGKVVILEKKRRDLAVACVRDRVVHRFLYDYLVTLYDKTFDPDVWSCRKGRGLHKCLARTQKLLQKHSNSYCWRADVTKFFDNVSHDKLLLCLNRKIGKDKTAMYLCNEIIRSYNSELRATSYELRATSYELRATRAVGIPIGNLTSQIFSNIYLNEFDRFVRHILKPQAYVRYGDDFVLFLPTRKAVYETRKKSIQFLSEQLKLSLNPKNNIVCRGRDGLHFLGHVITRDYCVVDKHTSKSIIDKLTVWNAASYNSLKLVPQLKEQINRELIEKILDFYRF